MVRAVAGTEGGNDARRDHGSALAFAPPRRNSAVGSGAPAPHPQPHSSGTIREPPRSCRGRGRSRRRLAPLDPFLANRTPSLPKGPVIAFFALNTLGVTGACYFLLHYFVRERDHAARLIAAERERSELLLLNVLPQAIAERLKSGESPIADGVSEVGVPSRTSPDSRRWPNR